MNKKQIKYNWDRLKSCPDTYHYFRYVDGSLDHFTMKDVEKHLNSCPTCFKEMTSLVRDTFSSIDTDEQAALMNIVNLSQNEQVTRILAYQEQDHSQIRKLQIRDPLSIFNSAIKNVREILIGKRPRFRPIRVMGTMMVMLFAILWGTTYFRISYPIRQAQQLLKDNYRIFIEAPRLSGGYQSTGISMLMSADNKSASYLARAQNHLLKAIDQGAKSQAATQLLAQIYIIEKDYDKADSLLSSILSHSFHSASVHNDLGVLYAEQKQWRKAAEQLETAITVDKDIREACYNLALIKIKLGSTDEAILILTEYINSETDMAWKDAAGHLLDEIKRDGGASYH